MTRKNQTGREERTAYRRVVSAVIRTGALLYALGLATTVSAQSTAGTKITNTASLQYSQGDGEGTVPSNESSLIVAELLDVTLTRPTDTALTVTDGRADMPALLRNTGNGQEAFVISATTAVAGGSITTIAIDVDGDGRFDPAHDTVLVDGRTPVLAAGETIRLVVVLSGVTEAATGSVSIAAKAVTGSGAPGTVFAGQGDGGSDAVVGKTGASASVDAPIAPSGTAPQLIKSAEVRDPDGGTQALHGSVITYMLQARFPGPFTGVTITDPIPSGTTYRAGSLSLDGTPLSDATDGDVGQVDPTGIAVALGTITGATTRTVRFQVTIQ